MDHDGQALERLITKKVLPNVRMGLSCYEGITKRDVVEAYESCFRREGGPDNERIQYLGILKNTFANADVFVEKATKSDHPPRLIGCGFRDFVTSDKKQEAAKNHILEVVQTKDSSAMVLMYGNPGTGKTMLGCAALWYALTGGGMARYTTVSKIARDVRSTYRRDSSKTEDDILDAFISCKLLFIDEIGASLGTDHERSMFNDVVSGRYNAKCPTIMASNLGIEDVKEALGDRLVDRIREDEGSAAIPMAWASWRGRKTA
jgi:DNA replication protein DnaC